MSATEEQKKTDHIGAEVSPDLKRRVRVAAAQNGVGMSQYLRDVLEEATASDLE